MSAGAATGKADFLARSPAARAESLLGRQSQPLKDPAEVDAALGDARAAVEADPGLAPPGWVLYALTEDEVEFWQADHDRRYVRLRYERQDGVWRGGRLWP